MRVCAEPGCPELVKAGARDGRCITHRRARDQARGTPAQRGYGAAHVKLRAHYQRLMDNGKTFACWRCSQPIDMSNWCLGHDDADRTKYRGPECPACNYSTASRR